MTSLLRTSILGLSLGLLPLSLACGDKDGGGGGGGDGGGDGGDGGADTGAGGDTGGSGTDTGTGDGGADTGERPQGERFLGTFTVRIFEAGGGAELDACLGQADLVVRDGGTPPISGNATCTFRGDLADDFEGELGALIDGGFEKGGRISGTFTFGIGAGIISDDWTGSVTKEGGMRSTFNGTATVAGSEYDYSGGFDVNARE